MREAALADACVSDDRRPGRPLRGDGSGERVAQRLQLSGAPDEGQGVPTGDRPRCGDREQPVGLHLFSLALESQWGECFARGQLADQAAGEPTEDHLARRRRLLQAGGDIHSVTGDEAERGPPGDNKTRVDADRAAQPDAGG